jgi:hypothetical protein
MLPQELRTPPDSPPHERSTPSRPRRRLRILGILLTVTIAGIALLYWSYSCPLALAERELVGKWAIPIGLNPPANAVQTVYEFRVNRGLTVFSRPIGDVTAASQMTGTWRIEDGHLVMDAIGPESRPVGDRVLGYFGVSSPKLFGNNPDPPHMQSHYRILGCEGGILRLEDEPGSVLPLVRTAD